MKKTLPLVAGLAGTLFVSGMAQGGFLGISLQAKNDPAFPRLLICNLYIDFSAAGDKLLSVNGLIVGLGQPQLILSTNSTAGFHQELFAGVKDFAVDAFTLGGAPGYLRDTYINVGIKAGETTAGGIVHGSATDLSSSTPTGIIFGWNAGGKALTSDPVTGGAFIMATFPAGNDQNIAGTTPNGNSIFLASLVIEINGPTNDGAAPRIDVQLGNLIWQDGGGTNFLEGFDPMTGFGSALTATHIVPAPGTLALLGLAGLAGIRRRRR